LVRRKFEQSTTVASQRHLGGQTGLLLQSLFKRVSSAPETNIKMLSEKPHSSQESINGPFWSKGDTETIYLGCGTVPWLLWQHMQENMQVVE